MILDLMPGTTYATLGSLQDDGRLCVARGFEGCVRSDGFGSDTELKSLTSYDGGRRSDLKVVRMYVSTDEYD